MSKALIQAEEVSAAAPDPRYADQFKERLVTEMPCTLIRAFACTTGDKSITVRSSILSAEILCSTNRCIEGDSFKVVALGVE